MTAPHSEDNAAPAAPAPRERFWPLVWEALGGSRRDLTAMPLNRAILLLAVPMVLEMAAESLFAVADIFWAAKLGADAVTVISITESLLVIIYALSIGLSMGIGALVSRRIGAKDHDGAARAAAQGMFVGVALSVVVGVVGVLAGPALLGAMGVSEAVQTLGASYSRIMLGGCVVIVMLFLNNASFRGAGDASITLRTLWLSNGINILLGPLLIFGLGPFPRMGVTGAAIATTIGRGTGVLFQLWAFRRGTGRMAVRREHLRIDPESLRTIFRIARTGIVQMLVGTTSWVALMRIMAPFGSAVIAGYGIAIRVVLFALLPSWGLGNAAATLVGQNLGARHPDRAEQAVWRAALYNLFFLGGIGALFVVLATPIVRLFNDDPTILDSGSHALRIVAAGFPLYAYGMVLTQSFNGAGDTRTPTFINLLCFWLFEIPLAYVLARPVGMGASGIYLSIALAFSLMAGVSVTLFRRGRWKTVNV
jgi:putative MATE family efflux protein